MKPKTMMSFDPIFQALYQLSELSRPGPAKMSDPFAIEESTDPKPAEVENNRKTSETTMSTTLLSKSNRAA